MTDPTDVGALTERLRTAGCVFAEDEAVLLAEAASGAALEALVGRRIAGEPLESVLGWAAFAGLRIAVDRGVFVPRVRTELLAELAVRRTHAGSVVVDLCCGTGAVAAVVAHAVPDATVHAADIDPVATANAERNLGGVGRVWTGDLFDALPDGLRGRIDVLAVNAPYVPSRAVRTMPPEAREHEPLVALDGGEDGLAVHRRVAAAAADWLAPGGAVLIETSEEQADRTAALLADAGLTAAVLRDDDRDATVALGVRPA
jgi:release factor glutamine methyltransferase